MQDNVDDDDGKSGVGVVWSPDFLIVPEDLDFSQSSELQCYSDNAGSPNSLSNIDTEDLFIPGAVSLDEDVEKQNWLSQQGSHYNSAHKSPIDVKSDVDFSNLKNEYSFGIEFEPTKKLTKSTAWTYSESLNKLFVDLGKAFPVKLRTSRPIPIDTVVCCSPIYSQAQYKDEVVRRCPNHLAVPEKDNTAPQQSFVRCESKSAVYRCDPATKRWSVCMACDQQAGDQPWGATLLYRMMCFTSCVGGINRRPVELVFTLECGQGVNIKILGRCSVELRVCACPGRDRLQEEHSLNSTAIPTPISSSRETDAKRLIMQKKPVVTDPDSRIFTLQIKGHKNYKILKRLAEALEFQDEASAKKMVVKKEDT